jgi:hypothetical protein
MLIERFEEIKCFNKGSNLLDIGIAGMNAVQEMMDVSVYLFCVFLCRQGLAMSRSCTKLAITMFS